MDAAATANPRPMGASDSRMDSMPTFLDPRKQHEGISHRRTMKKPHAEHSQRVVSFYTRGFVSARPFMILSNRRGISIARR